PLANYVWNDASTNPDITISSADTVSLILTQNGCQYFDTIVVDYTVPFQPNLISDTMLCPGQSFQIAFSNNYSFLWSNNSTDSSLVIDSPGLYWVEINDHGCIVIDSISVQFYPDPTVNLGNDTVICNATALSLDVFQQNATYVWHNNSSASNYTATNTELIWVTLTDSNNCQVTDSIYVEKIDITLDLGPDLLLCDGDVVELNALQPFMANYQWQDNSYSSSYSITSAGQYFVTVSSSICQSSDTVNVDYINLIPDFTGDSAICYGSTIAFTNLSQISSNDYIQSYLWEFGDLQSSSAENPIHLYNAAGQYDVSLTITSSFGCSARITANNYVQVYAVPEASFIYQTENTDAIEPLIYFESTSPNSDNWFWKINNVPVAATENFTYDFDAFSSGYQYVELIVTNDFGCSDTVTQYIKIDEATILYVPNAFTPFNAGNLNNTFKPIFTSGFEKQSYRFMIFNRWGEVIFESMDPEVGWDGTYGNKLCEMGVYVWYIEYMDDQSSETKTVNGTVTLIR
ncbi:MAG: PKD domain-containing protein, partial [Putridiphycobacter sp.]|nr:PKD domain-containing protein [Putridiphycobacter sp.]